MLIEQENSQYKLVIKKLIKLGYEIEELIQSYEEETKILQAKIVPYIEEFTNVINILTNCNITYDYLEKKMLDLDPEQNIKKIINNVLKYSEHLNNNQILDLILKLAKLKYKSSFEFYNYDILCNRINMLGFMNKEQLSKLMSIFYIIKPNESFLNKINLKSIYKQINKINNFNKEELENIFIGLQFIINKLKDYDYLDMNKLFKQTGHDSFILKSFYMNEFNGIFLNTYNSNNTINYLNSMTIKDEEYKKDFFCLISNLKNYKCSDYNLRLLNKEKFIYNINNMNDITVIELTDIISTLIYLSFNREELLRLNFNLNKIICKINEFTEQSKFSVQEILTLFDNLANLELKKGDLKNLSLNRLIDKINEFKICSCKDTRKLFFLLSNFVKLGYKKENLPKFDLNIFLNSIEKQKYYLKLYNENDTAIFSNLIEFNYTKDILSNFNLDNIILQINNLHNFTLDQILNFIKNIYAFDYTKSFLQILDLNNLIKQLKVLQLHSDNYLDVFKILGIISGLVEFGCTKNNFIEIDLNKIVMGINNMNNLSPWQLSYIIGSLANIKYTKEDLINLDLNNLIIQINKVNNFDKRNIIIIQNSLNKLNYTDNDLKKLDFIQGSIVYSSNMPSFSKIRLALIKDTKMLQTKKAFYELESTLIKRLREEQLGNRVSDDLMNIINEEESINDDSNKQTNIKIRSTYGEEWKDYESFDETINIYSEESKDNETSDEIISISDEKIDIEKEKIIVEEQKKYETINKASNEITKPTDKDSSNNDLIEKVIKKVQSL